MPGSRPLRKYEANFAPGMMLLGKPSDIRARAADRRSITATRCPCSKGPGSDDPSVPPPEITRSYSQGLLSCSRIIPFFRNVPNHGLLRRALREARPHSTC